jgi:hypothetical protein
MILGCRLTWNSIAHSGSGSDEERAVRPDERGAESLDCVLVLFTDRGELREVLAEGAVVEGEVNHAIGLGGAAAQAFHIFKVPAMHFGPEGEQRLSASVASSEAEHLMASVHEFPNSGMPDETCSTGNKYLHQLSLLNCCDTNESADGYRSP